MTTEFTSPLIDGLSKLIKCEGYAALESLYDAEEKIILRDLTNAKEDAELRIIQGRAKALKKFRHLPEETVDRYLNEKKGSTHD